MSSFTLFVLIVVVIAGLLGWRSGLLKQIGRVAGIILGIVACRLFAPEIVTMLCGDTPTGTDKVLYTILAYVLLFLVVYTAVSIVATLARRVLESIYLGVLNRIGGAVFSIVEWLVILSLLLNLWVAIVPDTSLSADPWFDRIVMFGPYLLGTETALKLGTIMTGAING